MFKNLLKKIKENLGIILPTVGALIAFLIVYRISKMTMDGWASRYAYRSAGGFLGFLKGVFDIYVTCNGRISSNIVSGFFESFPSEIPLDILYTVSTLGMFLVPYLVCKDKVKISNLKYLFSLLLFSALVLAIDASMRIEVLFYANIAYLAPIPLALLYYYSLEKLIKSEADNNKKLIVFLSILGVSIGMWMEHIALGFLFVSSISSLILFIKKDAKKWKALIPNVLSIIGFVVMMVAPGLHKNRVMVSADPLIDIIINDFKILFTDVISKNLYLVIVLAVLAIAIVWCKKKRKIVDYIFLGISAVLMVLSTISIVYRTYNIIQLEFINNLFPTNFLCAQLVPIIIVFVSFVATLFYCIFNIKNKKFALYTTGFGLFSLAPILVSPNTGARISSIGFFAILVTEIIILFEIKLTKFTKIVCVIVMLLSFDAALIYLDRIKDTSKKIDRITDNIRMQQEMGTYNYQCFSFAPYYALGDSVFNNILLQNAVHYEVFLDAFDLNPRTRIIFVNKKVPAIKTICVEDDKLVFHNDLEYKDILSIKVQYFNLNNPSENMVYTIENANGNYEIELKCGYYIVDAYYFKSDNVESQLCDHYEFVI